MRCTNSEPRWMPTRSTSPRSRWLIVSSDKQSRLLHACSPRWSLVTSRLPSQCSRTASQQRHSDDAEGTHPQGGKPTRQPWRTHWPAWEADSKRTLARYAGTRLLPRKHCAPFHACTPCIITALWTYSCTRRSPDAGHAVRSAGTSSIRRTRAARCCDGPWPAPCPHPAP